MEHKLPKGTVLIAGGGPIGLTLARVLAHYDIPSILFERNPTTTDWPKMDLTNARSMELFRMIGLAAELREQGVPAHFDQDVLISTGMGAKQILTKWDLPGVEKFRQRIRECNDGSMPLEPYQRLSQALFEKWLKGVCEKVPLIQLRYGFRVESVEEKGEEVRTTVVEIETEKKKVYVSDYVAGCDGASSRVRKSFDIPVDGGPIPACAHLVHFKSRDLTRLHKHGRFWHIFFADPAGGGLGGAIIAQDEIDTWTTHLFVPLDFDSKTMEAEEVPAKVLGGLYDPYPIEIDKILVRSTWRPHISVTRHWNSPGLRCFLAGDAAHLNVPTGGYGMNMGVADAFDLGWKLASVIHGYGGQGLLQSYELERKPVAQTNVERSGVHFNVHQQLKVFLAGENPTRVDEETPEAEKLRKEIHEYYQEHDNENKDFGIEMGYRYRSPAVIPDTSNSEPAFDPSRYIPTTWPGGRPPHVFLSDNTPMFDRFGKYWSLLVFAEQECGQKAIVEAADTLEIPLKAVNLSEEQHAKKLYERKLVLIRPDQHVAWRADGVKGVEEAKRIMETISGR